MAFLCFFLEGAPYCSFSVFLYAITLAPLPLADRPITHIDLKNSRLPKKAATLSLIRGSPAEIVCYTIHTNLTFKLFNGF